MSLEHHQRGVQAFLGGRVEEGLQLVGWALGDEETSEAWNDWAVIQGNRNQLKEAEEGYRRALELNPEFTQAAANLGLLLWSLGRFAEARSLLERVAAKGGEPNKPEVKSALQKCRDQANDASPEPDNETLATCLRQSAGKEPNEVKYLEVRLPSYLASVKLIPTAPSPGLCALEIAPFHHLAPALKQWKAYTEVRCVEVREGEHAATRNLKGRENGEGYAFPVDTFPLQSFPWPYSDEHFDLVIFHDILEHLLTDPMGVMAEINRLLKVGGLLQLIVPNVANAQIVDSTLRFESPGIFGKYPVGAMPVRLAPRAYAPREVERLASAAGFATAGIQTCSNSPNQRKHLAALASRGIPIASRGDTILFLGRKECGVQRRYPEELYELQELEHAHVKRCDVPQTQKIESSPSPGNSVRVLVIHEIMPEFDRSGSEQRNLQVLRALRNLGCAVTFVARNAINKTRYVTALQDMGMTVFAHDVERLYFQKQTGPLEWSFENVLKEGHFDVAFLLNWFWSGISVSEHYMDEIRRVSPETRVAVVCDDPNGPRELALAKLSGRLIDWERAKDYDQREREIYSLADLVVTVSETNRQTLLQMRPDLKIELLPNEAESLIDPSPKPGFNERKDLLFLGDFSNFANRDGLQWFMQEVWPRVREQIPGINLDLAGSNLPRDFAVGKDGVTCLGFVPDLKPLFAKHRVFISPARYGISTRTKNLNALAQGLPIVTTSAGAEGLFLENEREALLAESPEDFAQAVCRLYTDSQVWQSLAERGPAHIREVFSQQRLESTLQKIIQRAMTLRPREYDPEHTWSVMQVERSFPQISSFQSGVDPTLLRVTCYLRLADKFLEDGNLRAALEQLRHPFSFIYGEIPRTLLFARVVLNLERCYRELGETDLPSLCRQEAQICILPPLPDTPAMEPAFSPAIHRKKRPAISVVIPTCNRSSTLELCLAALDKQSLPHGNFEVIVVDDGSSDNTESLCRDVKHSFAFKYLRQANAGAGAARRLAVRKARGQYLLLFNDDTIAGVDLLARHLQVQSNHSQEKFAVLGNFRYPPETSGRALTFFLSQSPFLFPQATLKAGIYSDISYFVTCNLSVPRNAVIKAGSFDPLFRVAEDSELGARLANLGFRVLYDPEARAIHHHISFTIGDLIRRARTYGRMQLSLFRKHPKLLRDGTSPFGNLDEGAMCAMRSKVARQREEVEEAVWALEKFDSLDFIPFFARFTENRTAAEEVMALFGRAVPIVYWFHHHSSFLEAWDEEQKRVHPVVTAHAFHGKEARA